jgi:hypothetical protein
MKTTTNALAALALLLFASHASAVLVCTSADDNYDDADGGAPGTIQYATWYVGQPTPSLDVGAEQFVSCAANGAELTYITTKFTGLPMRGSGTGRTVLWRGESATFILDNL